MKSPDEGAGPCFNKRPTFLINRSFGLFWIGQSISTLGSQVTAFAVPLLAALTLHATAQQMGFLRAAEFAPFLVLTLPAGVWADLGIRRFLMIFSNLIRGVLIIFVPLAVLLGLVRTKIWVPKRAWFRLRANAMSAQTTTSEYMLLIRGTHWQKDLSPEESHEPLDGLVRSIDPEGEGQSGPTTRARG